jgi:hypothetical protein
VKPEEKDLTQRADGDAEVTETFSQGTPKQERRSMLRHYKRNGFAEMGRSVLRSYGDED